MLNKIFPERKNKLFIKHSKASDDNTYWKITRDNVKKFDISKKDANISFCEKFSYDQTNGDKLFSIKDIIDDRTTSDGGVELLIEWDNNPDHHLHYTWEPLIKFVKDDHAKFMSDQYVNRKEK